MSNIPGDFAKPTKTKAYAANVASGPLTPFTVTRRACGPNDVVIAIKYAGICHSDIHQVRTCLVYLMLITSLFQVRQEWGPAIYPMVPGHEIGGHVLAVGKNVKKFTVGDSVGVGCIVDRFYLRSRYRRRAGHSRGEYPACSVQGILKLNARSPETGN